MILLGRGIGINTQGTFASWVVMAPRHINMVRLVVSKVCLERDYAKANFCSGETGRSLRYKRGQWMLVCNDSSEHWLQDIEETTNQPIG